MLKKILAVLLAVLMLATFATGCKKKSSKKKKKTKKDDSYSMVDSGSGGIADDDDFDDDEDIESTRSYMWTIKTRSAFFRDTQDAKNSGTQSSDIKYYKNANTLQLGTFHFSMRWCVAYGTDFASREREFKEVVNGGYFNTYILDATQKEYLMTEAEIVAKSGGTIWLHFGNYHSNTETLSAYTERVRTVVNQFKNAGYGDILNGVIWDEPMWNAQSNADFLAQSEVHYKVFGLRNFPVFATGEFSGVEGNDIGVPASSMGKAVPAAMKYVTDAAFDSYARDVQPNGHKINEKATEEALGLASGTIKDGRDYYTEFAKYLKKFIGHKVNYWWYPCAYNYQGLDYINEKYCIAHLEFMTEQLLKDEYPGGIIIYTYYRDPSKIDNMGMAEYVTLKDSEGNYKHYNGQFEKWEKYCKLLQDTTKKFNKINAKKVSLGV